MSFDASFVNGSFIKLSKRKNDFCKVTDFDQEGKIISRFTLDSEMYVYSTESFGKVSLKEVWLNDFTCEVRNISDSTADYWINY